MTSYSLSLKVAAERRDMEKLARQNTALESDLKALDAELRVRMRMRVCACSMDASRRPA